MSFNQVVELLAFLGRPELEFQLLYNCAFLGLDSDSGVVERHVEDLAVVVYSSGCRVVQADEDVFDSY